jgi:hypothetical protein
MTLPRPCQECSGRTHRLCSIRLRFGRRRCASRRRAGAGDHRTRSQLSRVWPLASRRRYPPRRRGRRQSHEEALAPRGASANQAMLVLGRPVDDRTNDASAGESPLPAPLALRRQAPAVFTARSTSAASTDITRNANTADDEHAGSMLANWRQSLAQARTFGDGRNTAHALGGAPRFHSDALARGPRFDARALGVPGEALLVFGRAEVGDGGAAGSAEGRFGMRDILLSPSPTMAALAPKQAEWDCRLIECGVRLLPHLCREASPLAPHSTHSSPSDVDSSSYPNPCCTKARSWRKTRVARGLAQEHDGCGAPVRSASPSRPPPQ